MINEIENFYTPSMAFLQNRVPVHSIHEPHRKMKPKLMDMVREALRTRHYSKRTEQAYCRWIVQFVRFHGTRHPNEMGEAEINTFLTDLAVNKNISSSTQNQALAALLFLYRYVINREVGDLGQLVRARKPKRLPVVMTREEAKSVLNNLSGDKWLMAAILYGGGLRLTECLRLRVQYIDFAKNERVKSQFSHQC